MDFALTPDQAALMEGLESLLSRHAETPAASRSSYCIADEALSRALTEAGFLDIAATEDMGALEASLVAERLARLPATVEASATLLVAPILGFEVARPLALISGPLDGAYRNLAVARTAVVERDGAVFVLPVAAGEVEPVDTIFAYPYGRFRAAPDLTTACRLDPGAAQAVRRTWRLAITAEAVGAMHGALELTVGHVKERRLFGRTLGSFQALQHRLAECHQIQRAAYHLLLKAAWSGDACDALLAATYVQGHVQKLMFDLHQFNGAMGLTNEHLLHFWTYRLRALQAELGGAAAAALEAADRLWPRTTQEATAPQPGRQAALAD